MFPGTARSAGSADSLNEGKKKNIITSFVRSRRRIVQHFWYLAWTKEAKQKFLRVASSTRRQRGVSNRYSRLKNCCCFVGAVSFFWWSRGRLVKTPKEETTHIIGIHLMWASRLLWLSSRLWIGKMRRWLMRAGKTRGTCGSNVTIFLYTHTRVCVCVWSGWVVCTL